MINNPIDTIKEFMSAGGVTVYRLHKLSGVSQSLIHSYLNGKSSPSLDNLQKLTDALGLVIEIKRDGDKTPTPFPTPKSLNVGNKSLTLNCRHKPPHR